MPFLLLVDPALRSANNGFVLTSAALVLMMTPGFGPFYAGFVRSRNVLNTMVMSFAAMGLVSVLWVLFGYSLAFSPGEGVLAPFIGGLQWAGLSNRLAPYGDGQLSQGIMHNHSSYLGTGGLRAFRLQACCGGVDWRYCAQSNQAG